MQKGLAKNKAECKYINVITTAANTRRCNTSKRQSPYTLIFKKPLFISVFNTKV